MGGVTLNGGRAHKSGWTSPVHKKYEQFGDEDLAGLT